MRKAKKSCSIVAVKHSKPKQLKLLTAHNDHFYLIHGTFNLQFYFRNALDDVHADSLSSTKVARLAF